MSDSIATASGSLVRTPGDVAMARLADRLARLAPPAAVAGLTAIPAVSMPRTAPAVVPGLPANASISARAAERAERSRSVTGATIAGFIAACAFIPYALVALALRLAMARVFFLDGQSRIEGSPVVLNVQDFSFSILLPLQVKAETITAFLTQHPPFPVSPVFAAYAVTYAEFLLPIMLVLGFGARLAALGLLILTSLMQIYVMPEALWSVHVYWASILLVLLSLGAGQISIDYAARRLWGEP
jgi:putative oxidoreductase